jgi:hypothetical protein
VTSLSSLDQVIMVSSCTNSGAHFNWGMKVSLPRSHVRRYAALSEGDVLTGRSHGI